MLGAPAGSAIETWGVGVAMRTEFVPLGRNNSSPQPISNYLEV